MTKTQVPKIAIGDKLRYKLNGREVTVEAILHEMPEGKLLADPKVKFPLIQTKELGAISYRLLRFPMGIPTTHPSKRIK